MNSQIAELYGVAPDGDRSRLAEAVETEACPFLAKRCVKARKSTPEITIGTCSVRTGKGGPPLVICPHRFLDQGSIFADAVHLLSDHSPGNELHLISEFHVPGGHVDFVLASTVKGQIIDFVGIELQALDTTGTVWPAREALLSSMGLRHDTTALATNKGYGFNWKMTAKTILMQLHHKISTFESVGKKLILVLQDPLMSYMRSGFSFGHLSSPAKTEDSLHFHPYDLQDDGEGHYSLIKSATYGTNDAGMLTALGLNVESRIDISVLSTSLLGRISEKTRITKG